MLQGLKRGLERVFAPSFNLCHLNFADILGVTGFLKNPAKL